VRCPGSLRISRAALAALAVLAARGASASPPPPDSELRYWDAKLYESAHGDLDRAIETYQQVARMADSPEQASVRARALLGAGRALHAAGELDEARRAYEVCRRITTSGQLQNVDTDACAAGARQVALEQGAVRRIPTRWTFDDPEHGFVLFSDRGSMAIERRDGDAVLVWSQEVAGPQIADLIVALEGPTPAPRGLRLSLHAEDDNALLELIVEDERGYAFALPGKLFRADRELRTWEIDLAELEPLDQGWPALEPGRVSAIRLRDSTGSQLPELRTRHRVVLHEVLFY